MFESSGPAQDPGQSQWLLKGNHGEAKWVPQMQHLVDGLLPPGVSWSRWSRLLIMFPDSSGNYQVPSTCTH